ncbi:HD domain-containing protein [Aureibacter tunicatorum]|uniref:HD domain-containing protein n=1 Tax=Aureibacter tunicatorum TaxID=866807 RepID=A0AAE3XKJ7_9BACT|nr:HD domain-containing protein [Aureibacter tunicatorum]MDR6237704.1 uncharacterized protein [Aureibacter tunicatorum]BDD02739.1 phosphohydrolase [Aureibacter tunicatorum]
MTGDNLSEKQQFQIESIKSLVKDKFLGEGSGHDWWHIHRVYSLAKSIADIEGGDIFVIELAALLHDIADHKFHDGDDKVGPRVAGEILLEAGVDKLIVEKVKRIVEEVSYKGAGVDTTPSTLEGKIVQDADRLDAIGAIGIARTFAYGGAKSRAMHDPEVKPVLHSSFEEYKKNEGPTINHFYEKLLLLKELMHTSTALRIAEERHGFMLEFLERFLREWEGKQ